MTPPRDSRASAAPLDLTGGRRWVWPRLYRLPSGAPVALRAGPALVPVDAGFGRGLRNSLILVVPFWALVAWWVL